MAYTSKDNPDRLSWVAVYLYKGSDQLLVECLVSENLNRIKQSQCKIRSGQ
jgi:hypothetical protein